MRHIGNNTNFQRLLKLVFTLFSTKNITDTIHEGILNALVCSAPNLKKLEIRHFGNKPFNCELKLHFDNSSMLELEMNYYRYAIINTIPEHAINN